MIPMSMSNMQINTKFVNHLQPEWSRFVTSAKQARDLQSMNFDQFQSQGYAGSVGKIKLQEQSVLQRKGLLAQVQEAGVVLNDEKQDFLVDSLEETDDYEDLQLQFTKNFKADHVDAYDSFVKTKL
uniref:Integrase, catalytic region, zinc finger, CCHC-type, peptidase aspartic, catalytic n=1 Tax=Tanacetum cinerariifolium TaxID=118510 RepID=A0A6L2MZ44_TANCI|nr:integrase, catalytic region, zinc finger, CCHC-type, peptidase aspartic, catalytic [Tanacetum cinerariifolium]